MDKMKRMVIALYFVKKIDGFEKNNEAENASKNEQNSL